MNMLQWLWQVCNYFFRGCVPEDPEPYAEKPEGSSLAEVVYLHQRLDLQSQDNMEDLNFIWSVTWQKINYTQQQCHSNIELATLKWHQKGFWD